MKEVVEQMVYNFDELNEVSKKTIQKIFEDIKLVKKSFFTNLDNLQEKIENSIQFLDKQALELNSFYNTQKDQWSDARCVLNIKNQLKNTIFFLRQAQNKEKEEAIFYINKAKSLLEKIPDEIGEEIELFNATGSEVEEITEIVFEYKEITEITEIQEKMISFKQDFIGYNTNLEKEENISAIKNGKEYLLKIQKDITKILDKKEDYNFDQNIESLKSASEYLQDSINELETILQKLNNNNDSLEIINAIKTANRYFDEAIDNLSLITGINREVDMKNINTDILKR